MKTRKNHILFYSIVLVLLSLALLVTCKAGLGESVDTTPPKLSIAYPPSNSIIRDWFIMGGLAEDETYVKSVTVVLKGKETHTFNAVVDKEKKQWTLEVNKPLKDGKYDVTVTAIDSANRKASSSVTYYIDNTPPILVLTRPSTRGKKDGSSVPFNLLDPYGEIIKFTGNWWDANSSEGAALSIHFFDKDGKELVANYETTIRTQNFDLEIAKDTNGELWEALKGACDFSGGSPVATAFTYTISLQDDAKVWQSPDQNAPTNPEGNTTKHYYINRDITANLGGGSAPSFRELSAYENGESVTIPETLKAKLDDIQIPAAPITWEDTMGKFTFDPENKSPSISIVGMENYILSGSVPEKDENTVSALPSFNIKIEPNKDKISINEDEIKITLTPYNSDGTSLSTDPGKIKETTKENGLKTGSIGEVITVNYDVDETNGSYCLDVSVADTANNRITQRYGFTINDGAPQLKSISPDRSPNETKINTSGNKFTVFIKGEDGGDNVSVKVAKVVDNTATEITNGFNVVSAEGPASIGNGKNEFSWELSFENAPGEGEEVTYRFWLYDGTYTSNRRDITFLVDNTPPALIRLDEPRLITESGHAAEGKSMVNNSTINVKGYASEDLEAAVFYISKEGEEPSSDLSLWKEGIRGNNTDTIDGVTAREFTATLSLASFGFSAEGSYTLWARFADDTFNKDLQNYGAATELIDVIYDEANPIFTEDNSDISGTALVYRNADVDFGGEISDGSGIAAAVVRVNGIAEDLTLNGTSWSWTLAADTVGHTKDGTYELEFIATDKVGKSTSFTRNVMIDTTAPTVVITSPAENEAVDKEQYIIKGTVDDGEGKGVDSIEYSVVDPAVAVADDWKKIDKAFSWSKEITLSGEGPKSIWVRANDGDGLNTSDAVRRDFFYDIAPPSLSEIAINSTDTQNTNQNISFSGKVKDSNSSGLIDLSVKINSGSSVEIGGFVADDSDKEWTWVFNVDGKDDGIYTLVFTATDAANKTTSLTRTVRVDKTAPTIDITKPELDGLVRTSYNFTGTASDSGSGIDKIEYSFDSTNFQSAYGTGSWSFTADPSGVEGTRKIYIRATDKAGNTSTTSRDFVYDKADPIVAITGGSAERFTNAKFSLAGTAKDSNGVESIEIKQKKDNGDEVIVSEANLTLSGDEKECNWTLSELPSGYSDPLVDGTYVYSVIATDKAGQESILQTATVTIDITAPTLGISSPATGQTGLSALSGSSYLFRGTATDAGVGVSKIYYAITQSLTAPTDLGVYTSLETSGLWSFSKQLPSELAEGIGYYLHVLGEDRSGNRTAFNEAEKVKFDVDLANPTFTETASTIPGTALVYRNADVTFGGVVSDGNDIKTAIVKVNGVAKDLILNGTSWSWTLEADTETHTKDGSYELEFIATDNVDKITSFTRNVMIDTKAPTLDITAPTSGEGVSSNSYTIRGTVDDGTGKGVSTLEYSLDNTNWTAITKAAAWSATGVNFSSGGQGAKTLWVRASDGLNDAVVKSVSFQYDTEDPSLSETTSTLGEAQVNRNTAVSFGGTASDSNALASVTVSVNGGAAVDVIGTANWSYELPANDGTYALVFTATDVAGKTASVKRNVLIDTTKPILSEITTLTGSWHKNATISVSGKAYDTDGSGLAKVEYQTRTSSSADWSAPQNFALDGNKFSGMVQFSDGATNEIRIRATDLAGNESEYSSQTGIQVDTIAPSFDITSPTSIPLSNGTGNLQITISATDEHSGANKVYAKVGSSVWGTNTELYPEYEATINESGEASLTISDLSKLETGNQRIYLRVDDKAGHNSAVTSQTVLIDKTPPTVNFSEPANSAKVNKTISLAGTANDTNGLAPEGHVIQIDNSGTWTDVVDSSVVLTGTNWTVSEFNTTAFTDESTIKIRVGIQDVAGNMDYAERSLSINQDGDRPVVRLTNVRPDGTTTLLNSSIVSGILLDDDGTVPLSGFAISEDGSDWTVASATALTASSEKALFYDVDTRSFQYAPSSGDGEKTLYFRIKDAAETTFTTPTSSTSEQLSYPKAQYSTDVSTATGEAVVFKVDTNPPDIHGDIHFDTTNPFSFDGDGAVGDDYRLLNNTLFGGGSGGSKSKFALRIKAKDAVGIASAILTIGSEYSITINEPSGSDGDWQVFTTSPIDVSGWPTGSYTVKLDVTDNSGQKSTSTREILVDNAAPTVEIISHKMNEQVTGDLILRGTAQDVGSAGLDRVEYQVGADTGWKSVEGSFAWNIDFTQAKSNVITTTGSYANDTHATVTSPGIWRLPIKIRVTDKAGNHKTHTHYLNIDPDGDKPIVEVMYPGNNTTLGGTVRIFGSATDNVRVEKVWMMIDVNDDGNYDSTDANYLSSKGYTVVQGPDHAYQFAVEGTASWNKSINGGGEFNPEGDTAKPIRFKVRAEDDNGTYGSWSAERTISFDNKVPQIGSTNPLKLVQYSNPDGTGDIIAERDYIANMYIRGEWYLTGSVWDESGIKAISITGSESATLGGTNTSWFVQDGTVGDYHNYQLKIPVGKSLTNETAGQLNYTIKVDDASEPSSSATANIYISYDNKAPVTAKIEHGEQEISTTNLITNSNRGFSMNSTVTEADSGFERLAFFFVRRGDVDRVYNPMYGTGNRTNISALTWDTGDIPRLKIENLTRNGEDSLQSDSLKNNENIRVGGLVRIAGIDRIIQSVDYGTGTVTFSPAVSQDHKTAEFAYAQIVNNMLVETGNWEENVLKTISNDDGDGMIEAVERFGGSYHWTATIDSKNIPDGPIELHYVAYDKAGNSVAGSVTSFVSNNRPRLAKVSLGTDLSGDGQFTSNEIVKYYEATTGEEESLVNLASQDFIVKAKLAVIPEFVGGNGDLRYTWTTNGNAGDAWTGGSMPNEALDGAVANFTSITIDGSGSHPAIVIEPSELTTMDDNLKLFSFGIWDETEETTQGTDSQWALLNAPMLVDVVDGVAPKVVINPFYWKSATDNSLYENSKTNGHIELEADLPNPPFSDSYSSGLFDRDPKVSGQISIRGTAYDDVRLSALYVHFGDGTDSRFDFGTTETKTVDGRIYSRVATFNSGTGEWNAINRWAENENGWKFTVIDEPENALDDSVYLDQRGHLVKWQLDIDTSKISGVARLDQLLRIVAEDANPNASSEATSGIDTRDDVTTNNVPSYQMDVVPYIRTIGSGLSKLKKNNPSVYNRTALGRYPVSEDETITVSGFNLGGDQSVSMASYSSGPFTYTVNGVTTLNNSNSNTTEYNLLPNGDNNPHLTDDVVLDVWNIKKSARSISGTLTEPVMRIVPTATDTESDNDIMRFAFTNGAEYFSMAPALATATSYQNWQRNYADFNNVAFTYDSEGNSYGIVTGLDTYPDETRTFAGRLTFISSRWGTGDLTSRDDNYYGLNKYRLESIGIMRNAWVQGKELVDDYIMDTRRFNSPTLATAVHSGTGTGASTSVYLAYYDKFQKQIRFRYGDFTAATGTPNNNNTNANTNGFGQFLDQHATSDVNGGEGTYRNNKYAFDAARADYSLIAGMDARNLTDTGNVAGKYVAIDVVPGTTSATDVVVAVWYDGADLKYSYKLNPFTDNDADQAHSGTAGYWSPAITIFTDGGKYCAINVDPNEGIHIAAQDSENLDLKYAYLSSYDMTYNEAVNSVVVDSYGITGTQVKINTQIENGKVIPYITYYNGATVKPKMAYLVPRTTMDYTLAGSDPINESYTGNWEISIIPTISEVQDDHINIGLWKTKAGVKRTSVYTATSNIGVTSGTAYGNGTANPVVGYAIVDGTQGYIETAQKK